MYATLISKYINESKLKKKQTQETQRLDIHDLRQAKIAGLHTFWDTNTAFIHLGNCAGPRLKQVTEEVK